MMLMTEFCMLVLCLNVMKSKTEREMTDQLKSMRNPESLKTVGASFGSLPDGTPVLRVTARKREDIETLSRLETVLDVIRFVGVNSKKSGIRNLCHTVEDKEGRIVELAIPLDLGNVKRKTSGVKSGKKTVRSHVSVEAAI